MTVTWRGVLPAITTPFQADCSVDHAQLAAHVRWLIEAGCRGIVALGSLGEGATLAAEEKIEILQTCRRALEERAPVISGIAALSTAEAVRLARRSAETGCAGLMVLPPYVYAGDWRELKAHVLAVMRSTDLPCMLYNNPIAYGADFLPEQIAELARECENLRAVKESSGDVRRITAIRGLLQDRLEILVGMDDAGLEGAAAGARGWVAGLANALPRISVRLWEMACGGKVENAAEIYRWFLPLLRLDTKPKFVQYIKLVQEMTAPGSARVRSPRLELAGEELAAIRQLIQQALENMPENFRPDMHPTWAKAV